MNRISELVLKGIESPSQIPPYISRKYRDIRDRVQYRNIPKQKEKIHDFIQQDRFAIIVLDSCRYDYFERNIDTYLPGDLKKAYTPATATINYIRAIWDKQYDIKYITGMPAPTNYAFKRKGLNYRPEEHFSDFVHVWKSSNKKELGAVPPEEMTKAALANGASQTVIHYVQPHAPYIGEYRLRDENQETDWGESLQDIYKKIGRYDSRKKVISDDKLQKAYVSNLRRVLESVREIAMCMDVPAVVTADHGEFLGENDRYIHGGPRHPILCEVPWFIVDKSALGSHESSSSSALQNQTEFDDQDVENQLEELGYL